MTTFNSQQITNNPALDFKSLEDEAFRIYSFGTTEIRIDNPFALNVNTKSGGHRVLDSEGVSHYIPTGWHHLRWKVKTGQPFFAF